MRRAGLFAAIVFSVLPTGPSQAQMTVDYPLPSPPEREAVLAGITADPSNDPKLLHYLLDFDLCTHVETDGSKKIETAGADGETYSPVFTSKERVRQVYGEDAMPLCATGRMMLDRMHGKRVVFDPTGPHSVTWPSDVVRSILKAEYDADPGVLSVIVPPNLPEGLADRLTKLFGVTVHVEGAWIAHIAASRHAPSRWRLEIHARADIDKAALEAKILHEIEGIDMRGLALEVVILPPSSRVGIGVELFSL